MSRPGDHTEEETTHVLLVDDQPNVVELYASWLRRHYEVDVATGGEEALATVDERTDVVLLDRDMPEMSGDEVLAEIRERGYDCATGMITAVKPDVDIVDMGFDEYICKPVGGEDLIHLVDVLLTRREYDEMRRRSFVLARKKALLESTHDRERLERHEEYQHLVENLEAVEADLQERLDRLVEKDDTSWLFRTVEESADGSMAADVS